ncbi:hypothetical protein [Geofilum rubicundum]|uniref:Uncharacterized protein n=1 Tax=Geofilum rubicundum JCM 15548 TaxID=1236989 RepID=A0A0E9LXB9_9BACT|nr:hypothetical protein [Geofilum rubicundum]GAO29933.1 hypothetical protein JCM15548_12168 [Geofilum rubicundum JCM 15548]
MNEKVFRFTEIEFYYYHEPGHEDTYTHPHQRAAGEWRFHSQGFDLTLEGDEGTKDGGILIRGLYGPTSENDEATASYVNGPRKVLVKIFEAFGSAFEPGCIQLKEAAEWDVEVYKVFRHIPNKEKDRDFIDKPYRYLVNLDNLDIHKGLKGPIKEKMQRISL